MQLRCRKINVNGKRVQIGIQLFVVSDAPRYLLDLKKIGQHCELYAFFDAARRLLDAIRI